MVRRTIILLMDSFGVGASADAERYGDVGSDTLGHIAETCAANRAMHWSLPNLTRLGLQQAYHLSTGKWAAGLSANLADVIGLYGAAKETSAGKDTPSGHWEIAGVPVTFDWGYFPKTQPCFPQELIDAFVRAGNLPGVLGNKHASGTEIIAELGEEHIRSGKPIVYTSADSVFQIACHEEAFGLERLYDLCHLARKLVDPYNIGRVIARPFVGERGNFKRTGNRHDYSVLPPAPTLLDKLFAAGKSVIGIGKISDIFAHQGISKYIPADGNMALFDATLKAMEDYPVDSLIFTNFVDFDMVYGHRRDVTGYGEALMAFDKRLPELLRCLREGDLLVITADHGCDPSMPGSDHTREHVPVLCYRVGQLGGSIGLRESFADIGQSIAAHMGILPLDHGKAFL